MAWERRVLPGSSQNRGVRAIPEEQPERPKGTRRYVVVLGLLIIGAAIGVIASAVGATAIQATSGNDFCVSCHEMTEVAEEYRQTAHYRNASGVRASCSSCHLPHENWFDYVVAKAQSGTRDLWMHFIGGVDTPEELNERRHELAQDVWADLQASDSETCRNCHGFEAMALDAQGKPAGQVHNILKTGTKTCIDCHKGIAHELPKAAGAQG